METKISNPYIRKIKEKTVAGTGTSCSMAGVISKIMFFTLLTAVGICADVFNAVPEQYRIVALLICAVVALLTAIINVFLPAATPILGSLFCLAEGYIIGWTCRSYSAIYNGIVPVALLITIVVVASMAFLYGAKIIKVNQRFRAIVSTLFVASIVFGLLLFISSFFTSTLVNFFYGNIYIAIGLSALDVIIAAAYLVVDFDNISICVSESYPKKCEWALSFGLVMSIIILFLRILELVARIAELASDN